MTPCRSQQGAWTAVAEHGAVQSKGSQHGGQLWDAGKLLLPREQLEIQSSNYPRIRVTNRDILWKLPSIPRVLGGAARLLMSLTSATSFEPRKSLRTLRVKERGIRPTSPSKECQRTCGHLYSSTPSYILTEEKVLRHGWDFYILHESVWCIQN